MNHSPTFVPGPDNSGVVFPPPLWYVLGLFLGSGLQRLWPMNLLPSTVRAAGVVVIVAGFLLGFMAIAAFRKHGTSVTPGGPATALVQTGVYRFSRNPMYLGLSLGYFGFALLLGNVWMLWLGAVIVVIIDRRVITAEERYLSRIFGPAYTSYTTRVRRWV